jgi:WD40 repeat protein
MNLSTVTCSSSSSSSIMAALQLGKHTIANKPGRESHARVVTCHMSHARVVTCPHELLPPRAVNGADNGIFYQPSTLDVAAAEPGADGLLKLWDARTGANIASFEGHEDRVWGLAASAGQQLQLV